MPLTYEDYAALPEDGRRYELLDGELTVTPSPSSGHQRIVVYLTRILADHIERRRLGELLIAPFDCILSKRTVVEPDLLYVRREDRERISRRGVEGPPTLAIEVTSPSTKRVDRERKLEL